jgi:hypothetical protein
MSPIKLGHNPFARHEIHRHQIDGKCDWCDGQNSKAKVWQYVVTPDDSNKPNPIKGKFCSNSCLNSYHSL